MVFEGRVVHTTARFAPACDVVSIYHSIYESGGKFATNLMIPSRANT
jgi:hypothetical protein